MNTGYPLKASPDFRTYFFKSISSRKTITKCIEFKKLNAKFAGKTVYNIAFGDLGEDNQIDDLTKSNNGDIVRIISTIIQSIYEYTSHYDHVLYFKGSTEQRTKFYQAVLRRHYDLSSADFDIFGIEARNYHVDVELFNSQVDYIAFLIARKRIQSD